LGEKPQVNRWSHVLAELLEISSEFICAKFSTLGAELKSLSDFESGIEYIWQGDEKYWKRSAPWLFPIVGKLRDDQYWLRSKFYKLSQHGFARDMNFEVAEHEKDMISFRLESSDKTKKNYPFQFRFNIKYKVYGPKLLIECEVRNVDKKEMLFSLGFHPAFNVPMNKGEKFEDYYLEFSDSETRGVHRLHNGLVNFHEPDNKRVFHPSGVIAFKNKLFNDDALILSDPDSESVTLRSQKHDNYVRLQFGSVPYLGLWSAKDAPFVCVEPWYGVADAVDSNGDFYEKEGLIILEAGDNFKANFELHLG